MDKFRIQNYPFLKDFIWYFLGSFVPLFIGFIKTPIFTRHFGKEDYGFLGIVTITYGYLGMILFSWLGSCLWRYFSRFDSSNSLIKLYSNLAFLYFLAIVALLFISLVWYNLSYSELTNELIFYSFFQIIFNQLFLYYMVVIRLKGKAVFYTIFQTIRAIISVAVALILVFWLEFNISALVLSLVLIDFLAVLFLIILNPAKIKFNIKLIEKENLKELITYGGVGLILNLSLLLITSSDRYIIYLYGNLDLVGIYDQVCKLSQLFVAALVTIYFNTINPTLLKELENNFENSGRLIQKYMQVFIIYGLPLIFYLSLFSKDISNIFLGEEFREAHSIMPFVFLGAYLRGFSNFYELRLKFSNKLKKLSLIALSMAGLNIILNFIFVGMYGYKWAAVTTAFTYIFLVLILNYFDSSLLSVYKTKLYKILLILVLQVIVFYALSSIFEMNIYKKVFLSLIFLFIYYQSFKKQFKEIRIPINYIK